MPDILSAPVRIARHGIREDSQLDLIVRRFMRNKLGVIGLVFTVMYFLFAMIAPEFVTYDPSAIDAANRLAAPSLEHPFGTDRYGRDVFTRVIVAARQSVKVATLVVVSSGFIGVTLGLVAGYYRGLVDEAIMRSVDVLFVFPIILMGLIVIAILGPGLNNAIIALSIAYLPIMIRITRGSAVSVREEEYVLAATAYGENSIGIMFRDMLPNLISAVMVQATITFAFSILSEAGLSYLGLSAQPPTVTWGLMVSEGQTTLEIAPWVSFFPGLAIMLTVLGLSFFGMGLRSALDPKMDIDSESMGGI